ncbi:NXRD1 protein, partial [Eulacestoma nigropectus]|nr:NXRD1 protein [Eulacestoma nigropectus]
LVVIFYAGLNSIMWKNLPHQKALKLRNDLSFPGSCLICAEQKPFCCKSFVSKDFPTSVTQEEKFDLTAVPLRKSLFSQLLEKRELLWCHLMPGFLLYQAPSGDWPTKQCGLVNTKTSLTSAVVEPSVILDDKSPFSTAASNSFSEIPEETAEYDSKFS